ncbi:hypothetical protein KFK09_025610 [Dendrobium nobile]|uniref:Rrn7/TAF1B N-terminal cyclin domain-containing protein n=1 Tax=Dendrobium nobile TaxID=94219 RepID=A0A8T3A533_DENNO|nr:hypothetical protein KFK09_025610 [Dendrobium nobile]
MDSPPWKQENGRSLFCDICGSEDFKGSDDGFFYCLQCGSQSQNVVDTQADADDVYGEGGVGAVYNLFYHRAKGRSSLSSSKPNFKLPSKEDILGSRTQSAVDSSKEEPLASHYGFEDGLSSPQDFGTRDYKDTEKAVGETRLRYVQGLQLMLQLQCEALVDKFGVSALICGMAITIWLRYVAVSRVFDVDWVERVINDARVAASARSREKNYVKEKQETRENFRPSFELKVIYASLASLRRMIPIYSTLAISFLSCHLAREAVLPTDIYKWVLEAKLPYLSAFVELEKHLGPFKFCPFSSRQLFRPTGVISASLLEATGASIAQSIGLRTPSVNFYAIAQRYLKSLSLPVAKILPQACRLYEWSLPSELWLSSCNYALPTRAYVMAILIVAIRILYNIHGQGIWERSQIDMSNSTSFGHKHHGAAQENDATELSAPKDFPCSQNSEFCTKELLQILDTAYHRISTTHEYSKDLRSYLKYCRDVIFAGLTPSYEEGKLIERLWDLYDKEEIEDEHIDEETEFFELKGKRPRIGEPTNLSKDFKEVKDEEQASKCKKICTSPSSSRAAKNTSREHMKFDMEDNGFQYLPPRGLKKADGYLHYSRQRIDGNLIFVAHADYYILLRACAKLAQVDPRILHVGVLKFEKKLEWIEQRIDQSLILLRSLFSPS